MHKCVWRAQLPMLCRRNSASTAANGGHGRGRHHGHDCFYCIRRRRSGEKWRRQRLCVSFMPLCAAAAAGSSGSGLTRPGGGGGGGSGVQLCSEKSRRQASTCTVQSSRLTSQQMVTTVADFHSELLCMHQYQGHC